MCAREGMAPEFAQDSFSCSNSSHHQPAFFLFSCLLFNLASYKSHGGLDSNRFMVTLLITSGMIENDGPSRFKSEKFNCKSAITSHLEIGFAKLLATLTSFDINHSTSLFD